MITINSSRLLNDLQELAQIGRTPDGGVTRLALSEADVAGREWFRQRAAAAGLDFLRDGAGNLSAVLSSSTYNARTLLAGSHLDTVANGGRFDGALGTVAALEALRTIKEARFELPVHLEAIAFTDEEGTNLSMLGSHAFAGQLTQADLDSPRGGLERLQAGMARLGLTTKGILSARRPPKTLAGFVEVHVEQGKRLEQANLDVGIVTNIVGIRSAWLQFAGQAAHAGTTPMDERADALWGATEFVQRARQVVLEQFSPGVMNCGQGDIKPGGFNIVPAEVKLSLEFRHGSEAQLDQMQAMLYGLAEEIAASYNLRLTIEEASRCVAAPLSEEILQTSEQAATDLNLRHTRLMSFAGHDTQSLSHITPSGLIFVPSVNGISHAPQEFTRDEDVINGANLLLHTLLALARR